MNYEPARTRIASKSISSLAIGLLLALNILASTGLAARAHADDPPTFYVAPSPPGTGLSGGSCTMPSFNSIQAAVTAAPSNSVVIVCPGTYTEQVSINKPLTLIGSGPSNTKVKAPAVLVPDAFTERAIVEITGSVTASIKGFTISGPGPGPCGSIDDGIFVSGGASAKITGNSIVSIRDNPISGCQNGIGIQVGRQIEGTSGTATIKANSISDYQKGGIVVDNTGSSATIDGNTVTGVGPTPLIAQNGIQVGRGAAATITQNSVSGNECDHIDVLPLNTCGPDLDNQIQDGGILLFNDAIAPLSVTLSENNIFGNDVGVAPFNVNGGIAVTGNNIYDNRYGNVVLYLASNMQIEFNKIWVSDPNAAGAPCSAASFCFGHSYTLGIDVLDHSNGNKISRNTVTVTADKYAILLDSSTGGNSVTCNNLSANQGQTEGTAAVLDLGTGNTVSNDGCCGESDGEGDFNGDHGHGHVAVDNDGCKDGDNDQVQMSDRGDGHDFQSTSFNSVSFDPLTNALTITGLGTTNGVPVAFTLVAIESGPTTPGWVSFVSSDGYSNAGPLTAGSIVLH